MGNCICNEENPIRKVLCPVHGVIQYDGHSKAPEKQNEAMFKFLEGYAEIAQKEAPTDEGWEKQISSELHEQLKDKLEPWAVDLKKVFEIVASQIQKEREKTYKEGYLEASHDLQGERAMGKSEAFSLVRRAIAQKQLLYLLTGFVAGIYFAIYFIN